MKHGVRGTEKKLSKIKPVGFNVLVKPEKIETKTAGGVYIPDVVRDKEQHGVQRGTIVKVGKACEHVDQQDIGKIAIFGRYAGAFIKDGDEDYRLIDDSAIKAVED